MAMNKNVKVVFTALMAAMTCVATMIIQIPSPVNGYVHLGDGFVLLSGIILGPIYGGFAAGIGSMFADLLSGYAVYAGATLVIKALSALAAGLVYHYLKHKVSKVFVLPVILAGVSGGIIVTVFYFLFEAYLLGQGYGAIANVPGNIVQNIAGIITSTALLPVLSKIPYLKNSNFNF